MATSFIVASRGTHRIVARMPIDETRRRRQEVRRQEVRAARRAAGQCLSCGGVPLAGRVQCLSCAAAAQEAQRRMKVKRLAAGLCIPCGKRPARPTAQTCESCGKSQSALSYAANVRRRAERLKRGLCARCGAEPVKDGTGDWHDRTYCGSCGPDQRTRINEAVKARRNRLTANGLCTNCGARPRAYPSKRCATCIEQRTTRDRTIKQARVSLGLCRSCGDREVDEGEGSCAVCRQFQAERRHEQADARSAQGLCVRCEKPLSRKAGRKSKQRNAPAMSGERPECTACRSDKREKAKARRVMRVEAGRCATGDGNAVAPDRAHCPKCLERLREERAVRSSMGVCQNCTRTAVPGRSRCPAHLASARECMRRRAAKDAAARA